MESLYEHVPPTSTININDYCLLVWIFEFVFHTFMTLSRPSIWN